MNIANNDGRSSGIFWPTSGIDKFDRQIYYTLCYQYEDQRNKCADNFDPYHNHCMNTVIS